jgi:hypothetical protein
VKSNASCGYNKRGVYSCALQRYGKLKRNESGENEIQSYILYHNEYRKTLAI